MFLKIINEDNLNLNDFCEWLLPKIKQYIKENTNIKKLNKFNGEKWDGYIIKNIYGWLLLTLEYLEIKKTQQDYIIRLDDTAKVDNISIINLAKFINYGNLSVSGYPIYDEAFEYFADNLSTYYRIFKEEQ